MIASMVRSCRVDRYFTAGFAVAVAGAVAWIWFESAVPRSPPAAPPFRPEVVRRAREATVVVRASAEHWGSGFVVQTRGGLAVCTNLHVVANALGRDDTVAPVRVVTHDGVEHSGTVRVIIRSHDLAFVAVDDLPPGVAPLPVSHDRPDVGERVLAWAAPPAQGPLEGPVLTVEGDWARYTARGASTTPVEVMRVHMPSAPGRSGGALLNSSGRAVGVVFGHHVDSHKGPVGVLAAVSLAPLAATIDRIDWGRNGPATP